ncbi:competence protein ComK [Bacillaceae bacterium W0354]
MVNVEKVKNYLINKNTMAILPNKDIIYSSIIYEIDRTLLCEEPPSSIIDQTCLIKGASFDGRRKAIEYVTKKKVMLPIPIDPDNGVIIIPTKKIKHPDCEWLSYCHIKECRNSRKGKGYSEIIFNNDMKLETEISRTRMQNQIILAGHIFGLFLKDKFIS